VNEPKDNAGTFDLSARFALTFQKLKDHFVKWEGNYPYMYLDSRGIVTVGIGHALAKKGNAQSLPFERIGIDATWEEIGQAFDEISKESQSQKAAPKKAERFADKTSLNLVQDSIDSILYGDYLKSLNHLLIVFPDFSNFPFQAQLALLDMNFNLGDGGFNGYKDLISAVKNKHWDIAALECHRGGVSAERNVETARQFFDTHEDKFWHGAIADWRDSMLLENAKIADSFKVPPSPTSLKLPHRVKGKR
jgi:GH24 family phage-related lysozyme (muramidase)